MNEDQAVVKHLEFIQNVITRMALNSFHVKAWSGTVVTAIIGLGAAQHSYYFALAYVPIFVFWHLDIFFLTTEKCFRDLYNKVRVQRETDFSMDFKEFRSNHDYWKVAFSTTLLSFHGMLFALASLGIFGCILLKVKN